MDLFLLKAIFVIGFLRIGESHAGSSCDNPLGMESGKIANNQITAWPSPYNITTTPQKGRLNHKGAWTPKTSISYDWFSVDLLKPTKITAIATQGWGDQWVTGYTVQFENSDYYNHEKIIPGNRDGTTVKKYYFSPPFIATEFSLRTNTWHKGVSLRIELYGCELPTSTPEATQATTPEATQAPTPKATEAPTPKATQAPTPKATQAPTPKATQAPTPKATPKPEAAIAKPAALSCDNPLGLESGKIADNQFQAWPWPYYVTTTPQKARLNHAGAWIPRFSSSRDWIRVIFRKPTKITAIATQGSGDRWVTGYAIQHGPRQPYNHFQILPGNTDGTTVKKNLFSPPFIATVLALRPRSWHRGISLRMEIYGCEVPKPCR